MKVTERDVDVMKYIYDMKFSINSDVHKMFFEKGKGGSSRYASARIKKLVDEGFLKVFKNKLHKAGFYFISDKGLNLIRDRFRNHFFPKKAPTSIDTRFFEHDRYVALCRIFLEKKGLAKNWISERIITHNVITHNGDYRSPYMFQNLQKSQIPDGLFETRKGEICAFELEFTLKSLRELNQKLNNLYHESQLNEGAFKRVLIVAGSNKIESGLIKIKKELSANFKIMNLDEVLTYE